MIELVEAEYTKIAEDTGTTLDFIKKYLSNVRDDINQVELVNKIRVEKSMQILRALKLLEPILGKNENDLLSTLNIDKKIFDLPYINFSKKIIIHINKFIEDINNLRKEILEYYIYNISYSDDNNQLSAPITKINIDPTVIESRRNGIITQKSVEEKEIKETSQKFVWKYKEIIVSFQNKSKQLKKYAPQDRSATTIGRIFSWNSYNINNLAENSKNIIDMRSILIHSDSIEEDLKLSRSITEKNDREVLQ